MASPCYKCQKRYVGCSATCPDWDAWKAEQAKEAAYNRQMRENTYLNYTAASRDVLAKIKGK